MPDKEYQKYIPKLIFTIVSLGFMPRLAIESSDGGTIRLNKIINLIKESPISIHDLSRIKSQEIGEFSRMNMPFELGLDFGCKKYSSKEDHNGKKYLILGREQYAYMKALSDISGIDIKYYDKEPKLVSNVRHWFIENDLISIAPSPNEIWNKFMDYNLYFYDLALGKGYSQKEMIDIPLKEQIIFMVNFLELNPY